MDIIRTTISNDIEIQHALHAKGKGDRYTIYLRFYILRKTIRLHEILISLGIKVTKSNWDGDTVRGSGFDVREKNEMIRRSLDVVRDALHDLRKAKIMNTGTLKQEIAEGLRLKVTNKPKRAERLQYLSKLKEHNLVAVKDSYLTLKPDCSTTYIKNFRLAVQKFTGWWNEVYGTGNPVVSEITTRDITQFKSWLLKQNGIKHNTVSTYLNRLRTIFTHAVSEKLISETPIPKGLIEDYQKGDHVTLTTQELIKIKKLPDHELSDSLKRVKYIFLFLCSTGMGYGELKSLRLKHIDRDGDDLIISKKREKTGVVFHLPLSDTAKHIYTSYFNPGDQPGIEPFVNLPSIEYVTRKVKLLAKMAGVHKNCSTYVGRRSFASQWANDGNNIYYLAAILGHIDINQTFHYVGWNRSQTVDYGKSVFKLNPFHTMN